MTSIMEQADLDNPFGYVRLESPGADARQTLLDDYQANYLNDFWMGANPFDGNNTGAPFANLNDFAGLFPPQQQFALTTVATQPFAELKQQPNIPITQPLQLLPTQPIQPIQSIQPAPISPVAQRRPSTIAQIPQTKPEAPLASPTAVRRGSAFSFGTDPNFAPNCFRPAGSTQTHTQIQKRLDAHTNYALKWANIATRPPSPREELISPNQDSRPSTASSDEDRPRTKRLKTSESSSTTPTKTKGGRVDSHGRRRNLTEDEKRRNHIDSEQKRRTFAKTHFTILNETIPALVGHKNPKAKTLGETHAFLVNLMKGNEELRALLKETKPA